MNQRSNSRTLSFIVFSVLTHLGIAVGVMNLKSKSEPKSETLSDSTSAVEISTENAPLTEVAVTEAPKLSEIAKAAEAPIPEPTPVAAPAPVPVASPTVSTATPIVDPAPELPVKEVKPLPAKKAKEAALPAKKLPAKKQSKVAAETTPEQTQEQSPVVIPAVQPQADDSSVSEESTTANASPDTQTETSTSEPESISSAQKAKEIQEAKEAQDEMDRQADKAAAQLAREQEEAKEKARAEAAALQAAQEKEAALQAEHQRQAEESARQAEAAKQAEAARWAEQAQMAKTSGGNGAGSQGEVRSLEDLKQVPGNKRPQYDADDRYHGRQGEVSFQAYVSKEGSITQFKLTKSSGHRQLDAKTLKALKSWKFYPGQEGWVEIPFQWDLKGEPKEKPTTLRVKSQVSQNGG